MESTSRLAVLTGTSIIFLVLGASLANQTGRPMGMGAAVGAVGGLTLAVAALRAPNRPVRHASASGDLYDAHVDGPRSLAIPRRARPTRTIEREWRYTRRFPAADEEGRIQMIDEWTQFITSTGPDGNRSTRANLKRYESDSGINLISRGNGEYQAPFTGRLLRTDDTETR